MHRCYKCGDDLQFEKNVHVVRYRRIDFKFCAECAENERKASVDRADNRDNQDEIDELTNEALFDFIFAHYDEHEPVDHDHEDRLAYQSEIIEARLAERRHEAEV